MKQKPILYLFLITGSTAYAQNNGEMVKGNEYYKQSQFDMAELSYRSALKRDSLNKAGQYNLGLSLYRQKKYPEATAIFRKLGELDPDKKIKSVSYYNEGVIYSKQKDLLNSIEAYKSSLRNDPDDKQARENLQKALMELKKQQQDKSSQQKEQKPSKLSQKEAERRLQDLQAKEKELQERLQKKGQKGNSMPRDW